MKTAITENVKCTSEPVDISTITVEQNLSKSEKIVEYIRQIKDPLHYNCGKFTITAYHPKNGPTLEDCLQGMMA